MHKRKTISSFDSAYGSAQDDTISKEARELSNDQKSLVINLIL